MAKVSTSDVIKYSAYFTEIEGYVKRSDDQNVKCTADKVLDAIESCSMDDSILDDVKDRVSKWFEYINASDKDNEYFSNVHNEMTKPMIDESKIGLIASSFMSFDKHVFMNKQRDVDMKSSFLGNDGDSVSFNISEYRLVKSGNAKYGNGKWYLYRIKDDHGNVIVHFSDHNIDYEFKRFNKAAGIISKLDTYNGVKQTYVSNLRFS